MIKPHRNKAIVGLIGCLLPLLGLTLLAALQDHFLVREWVSENVAVTLVCGGLILGMLSYFWTGYHLAKAKGHSTALVAFGLFPCLQPIILVVLLTLPDKNPESSRRPIRQAPDRPVESVTERLVRYRRNALLGNIFGLFLIFVGIATIYFPVGIFADFENETLFGFLIFVCGYVAVLWGCRWWVKVKGWPDALLFIGLIPPTILLIPFVREVFFIEPDLLPLSMLLMTLILLVVVFTLPNRSAHAQRHRKTAARWPGMTDAPAPPAKPATIDPSVKILLATEADLPPLAELAAVIWRQHYPGIISPEQIEYMLAQMYSLDTLTTDLRAKNISFFRLLVADRFVGFAALGPQPEPGVMKLHKCYLLPEMHGRGYGSLLLKHCEQAARQRGASRLILAVNKRNTKALTAYRRNGFLVAESVITDFGHGFVMDDFIMAKSLRR